jgi:hypothetical protein
MVTVVRIFGLYRDVHQLRGMARATFPQNADDMNTPCWTGERCSSELMEGRMMPVVPRIMNPDTLEASHTPTETQR